MILLLNHDEIFFLKSQRFQPHLNCIYRISCVPPIIYILVVRFSQCNQPSWFLLYHSPNGYLILKILCVFGIGQISGGFDLTTVYFHPVLLITYSHFTSHVDLANRSNYCEITVFSYLSIYLYQCYCSDICWKRIYLFIAFLWIN